MPIQMIDPTPIIVPLLQRCLARVLRAAERVFQRRRHEVDEAVAQGERLVDLMARAEHLLVLMLAKHHPFAPASAVNAEGRQLTSVMAEIEATAQRLRRVPELHEATDRLLDAGVEAAEFSKSVSRWRRVDMARWHTEAATWAAERIRFRDELVAIGSKQAHRRRMSAVH